MHGTIPVNNLALLANPESDDLNVGSRIVGRFSKGFEASFLLLYQRLHWPGPGFPIEIVYALFTLLPICLPLKTKDIRTERQKGSSSHCFVFKQI